MSLTEFLCNNLTFPPLCSFIHLLMFHYSLSARTINTSVLLYWTGAKHFIELTCIFFPGFTSILIEREWLVHLLLKVLSLEIQALPFLVPDCFCGFSAHTTWSSYIRLLSGALFTYCHILLPPFFPPSCVLPQILLGNLPYLPPLSVNTSLMSSSPVILYCSYCIHASVMHVHVGISSVTLQPALLPLTFVSWPIPPIVVSHGPQEANISSCHSSYIHSSIQQVFSGYQISATIPYVGVDSGTPYPFLSINFPPTVPFLVPNSWLWTLCPVDLTHHLDTGHRVNWSWISLSPSVPHRLLELAPLSPVPEQILRYFPNRLASHIPLLLPSHTK